MVEMAANIRRISKSTQSTIVPACDWVAVYRTCTTGIVLSLSNKSWRSVMQKLAEGQRL